MTNKPSVVLSLRLQLVMCLATWPRLAHMTCDSAVWGSKPTQALHALPHKHSRANIHLLKQKYSNDD